MQLCIEYLSVSERERAEGRKMTGISAGDREGRLSIEEEACEVEEPARERWARGARGGPCGMTRAGGVHLKFNFSRGCIDSLRLGRGRVLGTGWTTANFSGRRKTVPRVIRL